MNKATMSDLSGDLSNGTCDSAGGGPGVPRKITTEVVQSVFALPWLVAQEEGLFAAEDLEVEFVKGRDRDPALALETDPRLVDPFWRHAPFEERSALDGELGPRAG